MKRRHRTALRKISPFFFILALAVPAIASNPADTYGYSARGISLGNAMTAIVDDWSSVWYNPAGLGKTRHGNKTTSPETDAALKKKKTAAETNKNYYPTEFALSSFYTISAKSISGLTQDQKDEALNGTTFGMITVGTALDLNMIFEMPKVISSARIGIGATVNMDGSAMKINDIDPRTPDYIRYGRDAQRAVILAGFGLGFLNDMFGFGAAAFTSFGGEGRMDIKDVLVANGVQTPLAQTKMDMKMVPSANAGLYFAPGRLTPLLKGLHVGASYRMASKVEISPMTAEAEMMIFSMNLPMEMAIYDYYTPHTITTGVGYTLPVPLVDITVSFDFEYQLWSKFSISSYTKDVLADKGISIPAMKDVYICRIGIEVEPLRWLSVSTGYYYQPSMLAGQPLSDRTNFMDNDMHAVSLGGEFTIPPLFGFKGPLVINVGYQLQYFADTTAGKTFYNADTDSDEVITYTYGGMNHLVTMSVAVKI